MRCTLFACLLSACGAVAPVAFHSGTRWSMPLVAPLENRALVVPVTIEGHGPYLFLFDPGAPITVIDRGVAESIDLYAKNYVRVESTDGSTLPSRLFEILEMHIGDLQVDHITVRSAPAGTLNFRGQKIDGVLGGELITTPIVVDIDRDRGLLHLAVIGHEESPVGATPVGGKLWYGQLLTSIHVGGTILARIAVEMGATTSALFPDLIDRLRKINRDVTILDDTGHEQTVHEAGVGSVVFGSLAVDDVAFATFTDQRVRRDQLDGIVGEDFLSRFHVIIDRDRGRTWIAARDGDLGLHARDRIARWPRFASCAESGCARLTAGENAVDVDRDPAAGADPYEVFIEGLDADGKPVGGPLLRVTLPDAQTQHVATAVLHAASYRVVDASPFPVPCGSVCVTTIPR